MQTEGTNGGGLGTRPCRAMAELLLLAVLKAAESSSCSFMFFLFSLTPSPILSLPYTCCLLPQASPDTPIIVALNIFHERRVSALPIVNSEGGMSLSLSVVHGVDMFFLGAVKQKFRSMDFPEASSFLWDMPSHCAVKHNAIFFLQEKLLTFMPSSM